MLDVSQGTYRNWRTKTTIPKFADMITVQANGFPQYNENVPVVKVDIKMPEPPKIVEIPQISVDPEEEDFPDNDYFEPEEKPEPVMAEDDYDYDI